MKVTKENLDDRIKLTIDIEVELLKQKIDEVYGRLSKNIKIAGFRPGKAPRHLVEKEIGQDKLNAEVLDSIIPETYYQAVLKEDLKVVGSPEIKLVKFVPTDGLTYVAIVELMPTIKLPDLLKIKVKRKTPKIEDKDVEEVIDDLAKQLSKTAKVERPARKGDKIEIDFEGFVDNLPFEGGKSQGYPLILGQGQFVSGFEDQLIGMKESEEKEIEVTFPKDYFSKNLAGKKAKFRIKMNLVNEVIMPEVNDEFATRIGPFDNLKKLKQDIGKELLNKKIIQEKDRVESEILEKITAQIEIKVPGSLTDQEIDRLYHEAEHNLINQGMTMERYLEMVAKSREDLKKEMYPEAEKRIKIGLVLTEIARDIKTEITEKDIHTEISKRLEQAKQEERTEIEEFYDSSEGHHQIENVLIGEKVIDYLYEKCSN